MNLTIRKSFLAFKEAIRFSVTRQYQTKVSAAAGCGAATAPVVTEHLADWAVSRLVQLQGAGPECEGAEACRATQQLMQFAGVREAVSRQLRAAGLSPFLSLTHCEQLFPHCFYM